MNRTVAGSIIAWLKVVSGWRLPWPNSGRLATSAALHAASAALHPTFAALHAAFAALPAGTLEMLLEMENQDQLIDILTYVGSFGLFFTCFLLFCRFLPVIAMAEIKGVLPKRGDEVTVFDALTYAGNRETVADLDDDSTTTWIEPRIVLKNSRPGLTVSK